MTERKCLQDVNGGLCTRPEGHSGDHIAESGHVGNVIARRSAGETGQGEKDTGQR
jgi:hypothetical protein